MNKRKNKPEPKQEPRPIPAAAYSVEEAAQALTLGRTYTFKLIKEGKLRAIKAGRRTLIPVTEVQAFLARMAGGEA